MIEELKKNIDAEIEILREISTYSRRLEFATLSEDKLIRSAISSLRESIRLINKSIPELIKEVSVAKKLAVEKIEVFIKGIGAGRESAVRTLVNQGLNIVSIKDITPIPHNGCRPRKVRRV